MSEEANMKETPSPALQKRGEEEREFPYRIDWYQTDDHVIVTLFRRKENADDVQDVTFTEKTARIVVKNDGGKEYYKVLSLENEINPAQSSYVLYTSKAEIKMKKMRRIRWNHYECSQQPKQVSKKKDWDAFLNKVEEDKLEGDALLNQFFGDIYAKGSDEVKKAMIKSFYESGGTELSTNWDVVSKERVTVKPPDGMEWKQWDK